MNQKDFKRLKAVCEKEGFEIEAGSYYDVITVKKKDIWQGVEFVECLRNYNGYAFTGKVYKVKSIYSIRSTSLYEIGFSDGIWVDLQYFKPSTEQAYIEQLKKEAHGRFGEIKEGDRFKADWLIDDVVIKCSKSDFVYLNYGDLLLFNSTVIYKQGRWATRVKERVKVELVHETLSNNPTYQFKLTNWNETNRAKYSGQFLASQLEKYLNLDEYSVDVSGETLSIHVNIRNGVDLEDLKEKAESLAKIVKKI